MSKSYDPMDYIAHQAPLSMGFPRQEYWSEYLLLQLSSPPRDGTWVSCTAGKFFMDWATRENQLVC